MLPNRAGNKAMSRLQDHLYILATLVFTVYSQVIMRWQVVQAGPLPTDFGDRARFVILLLLSPWVLSSVVATFLAGVSWMLTMTRFELSYAYPWIGLNFVLIMGAGFLIFNEALSAGKLAGTLLVVIGIVVIARS